MAKVVCLMHVREHLEAARRRTFVGLRQARQHLRACPLGVNCHEVDHEWLKKLMEMIRGD